MDNLRSTHLIEFDSLREVHRSMTAESTGKTIGAFLVDDHPVYRMGLSTLLSKEPDLVVIGETDSGLAALKELETCEPDLIVIDLSLQDINGLELIKSIKKLKPDLPIFVLSMHDEDIYAERAIKLGARGYLMKQTAPSELVAAIRQVARGELTLSSRQADIIMKRVLGHGQLSTESPMQQLSDREIEVFELVGRGMSTRAIAEKLAISVKTVETHQAHIKRKLRLANHNELMRAGFGWVNNLNG